MKSLRKNKTKGFTLVELIVVIVIVAILVAAVTPSIMNMVGRANIAADEADARAILSAANLAYAEAIANSALPLNWAKIEAQIATGPPSGTGIVYMSGNEDSAAPVGVLYNDRSADTTAVGQVTTFEIEIGGS